MFAAQTLPRLLFGSIAGVFIDRWNRKRTMVLADLSRAVILLPLLAVAAGGPVCLVSTLWRSWRLPCPCSSFRPDPLRGGEGGGFGSGMRGGVRQHVFLADDLPPRLHRPRQVVHCALVANYS